MLLNWEDPVIQERLKAILSSALEPPKQDNKQPMSQGLMAAGLGMLANSRGNPWEALGQGGLYGLQAYNAAQQQQRKDPMQQIQMAQAVMGLDNSMRDTAYKQKRTDALKSLGDMQMPEGASRNATYQYFQQAGQRLMAQGLTEDANALFEKAEKYRPKVKETRSFTDPNTGQRAVFNLYEDGTHETLPFLPDKEKLNFQDKGDSILGLDPYSGAPATQYKKGATPEAQMTDARSREQFTESERRQAQQHAASLAQSASQHRDNLNKPTIHDTGSGLVAIDSRAATARPVVGQDGQPVEKSKDAPSQFVEAQVKNEQLLNKLGVAKKLLAGEKVGELQGDKKAMLPILGQLPGGMEAASYWDKGGVATRAAIADIGSQIVLNRSGAAVTIQEFERTRPFVPKPTDPEPVVRTKIAYLEKIIKEENDALTQQAKAMGFKTPKREQAPDPLGIR